MDGSYKSFYARFLGDFSLWYGEREIKIDRNIQKRSIQFLLRLLRAGASGVEREELLAMIRLTEKGQKKRLNNFYQQMHILRTAVSRQELPEGRYIVSQGTRYYFSPDHGVKTDVGHLDGLIEQMEKGGPQDDGYMDLCKAYCADYGGEFLPMLTGEEWVTMEGAVYQKWYNRCLDDLCTYLSAHGEYEKMLELCTKASQIHPYDEWQAKQIECLMAMGQYKEAMKVYEEATEYLYKDLGVTSLDRVVARYQETHKKETGRHGIHCLAGLEPGEGAEGADRPYQCSFPSFQDAYRIIVRQRARQGPAGLLMLCTLRQLVPADQDQKAAGRKTLEQKMLWLKQVLMEGLRTCDVYTRYSESQYLILLIGAGREDGARIEARLEKSWKRMIGRGASLDIVIQGAGEDDAGEWRDGEGDICGACRQPGERHLAGAGHMAG